VQCARDIAAAGSRAAQSGHSLAVQGWRHSAGSGADSGIAGSDPCNREARAGIFATRSACKGGDWGSPDVSVCQRKKQQLKPAATWLSPFAHHGGGEGSSRGKGTGRGGGRQRSQRRGGAVVDSAANGVVSAGSRRPRRLSRQKSCVTQAHIDQRHKPYSYQGCRAA
jgi:hypothetical protein